MILSCTACSTRYLVDPRALGPAGRAVRCARCGHSWHQKPDPAVDMKGVEPAPAPAAEAAAPKKAGVAARDGVSRDAGGREPSMARHNANLPAVRQQKRRLSLLPIVGGVVGVLIVGVVAGGLLARETIVKTWPGAARLYSSVGFTPAPIPLGVELRNVKPSQATEDGQPVLVVEGEVENISKESRDIPKVKILLRDAAKRDLQIFVFVVSTDKLASGAKLPFRTVIPQPSAMATDILVTFADGT